MRRGRGRKRGRGKDVEKEQGRRRREKKHPVQASGFLPGFRMKGIFILASAFVFESTDFLVLNCILSSTEFCLLRKV